MGSDAEAIDQALTDLASAVAERVSAGGWVRRDLDRWGVLVLTKPLGAGLIATAELDRAAFRWPQRWPETVVLRFGVGYEPALDLMPLVTLRARPTLVLDGPADGPSFELDGRRSLGMVADTIAAAVAGHSLAVAEGYDVDRLDRALQVRGLASELRPALLAAAGRHEQARELLDRDLKEAAEGSDEPGYQRFARQLRRWLDAGGPPIPPVEQTLRRLPPPPPRPRAPSWTHAREETRQRQAARDAVRAVARGKSHDQLVALLASEYATRDLDAAPSALSIDAEMIELDRQPFGKARRTLHALRTIKTMTSDGIKLVREHTPPNPEWMQPPEHASYPIGKGRRYAEVTLDPDAAPVLARAAAEATRRIGPIVLLDVWLTVAGDGPVTVHLGEHTVGTLAADAAHAFQDDLAAARELFDEAPRVAGRLMPAQDDRPVILEIGLPDHD